MGDALKRVVSRAISDAAFRRQLQTNPKSALKEFDLSSAEIAALTSGDVTKLTSLGIDQRMSRMLQVEIGAVTQSWAGDLGSTPHSIVDQAAGAGGLGALESVSPDPGVSGQAVESVAGETAGADPSRLQGDLGTAGTGELERLGDDPSSSSGLWTSDDPYGTSSIDRIDGAQATHGPDATSIEGDQLPDGTSGADTPHTL